MLTRTMIVAVAAMLLVAGAARADVFNLGGTRNPVTGAWTGVASLETVHVGDPGNAADTRYAEPGYGAVSYTYNIGKYEVTAGQYTEFLNKMAGVDTYALYNTDMSRTDYGCGITRSGGGTVGIPFTYSVAASFVNRPVNYVSWGDAARFTNWLHNGQPAGAQNASTTEDGAYFLNGVTSNGALLAVTRKGNARYVIPSEDEWYKAAYYKGSGTSAGYWDYPTKTSTLPGRNMTDATNPGNNANYYTGSGAYPIDSGKYTTVAGEFQLSESPYGTCDQGGNVWEWNEATIYGVYRCLRGGSFLNGYETLRASDRGSSIGSPSSEYDCIGFRVSEVPEPATLSLLAMGGLAMLRRRHQ